MSTHNIGFCEEITKIVFQLSSDTHFICSSVSLIIHWVVLISVSQVSSDQEGDK